MFTEIKLKQSQDCTPPSSTPTANKTCKKCQEIYSMLNAHIITDHTSLSGNDGILNNIILNMLSLVMSNEHETSVATDQPPTPAISSADRCQTVPMSVISRANDKIVNDVDVIAQGTLASVAATLNQTPPASFSSEFSNSPSDLATRLTFQPDLLSSIFANSNLQKSDFNSSQEYKTNIQPTKLLQVPTIELPFLLPNTADLSSTANLFTSDGTLTPAGISLLLANQNKCDQGSGKSDLDVADILVNKMPIPSLNKGFDSSSLLQLSTLYLQQLALNQEQQPQIPITAAAGNFTNEVANLMKHTAINHEKTVTKPKSQESFNQNESLQQLIARHKQISGLIESLSNKQKKEKPYKTDMYATIQTLPISTISQDLIGNRLPSISVVSRSIGDGKAVPVSIFPTPPMLRQTSTGATSPAVKPVATGRLIIAPCEDNTFDSNLIRKNIPIVVEGASTENLLNLLRSQNKAMSSTDSDIQFVRHKGVSPTKVAEYGVVVTTVNTTGDDLDSSRKRRYSSVSMVPISQYDPLDPNNEPLPTRVLPEAKVLYKCEVCNVTFSVLATLQTHAKSHLSGRTQHCNYCQSTFNDEEKYFEHIASHRGEENVFRCQFCPKIFTSKGDFNKHVTKHTQKRPYSCSHCQKAFRDPGSLTKHERIHTGEQPYVCQVCHRGFAEKSSLRKHLRVHSGEKPYKCEQCDKSFSISGNLQRHMFIHTGQRPFKCTQCSKAFNNPSHLRRHIKNLHERPGVNAVTSVNQV